MHEEIHSRRIAYVDALTGWRRTLVENLRTATRSAATLDERIKWGHLVYFSNGPALLIRAEAHRVLFGFWRGQRLRGLDERLKPGGKYEMATIVLTEGDTISSVARVRATRVPGTAVGTPHRSPRVRPSSPPGLRLWQCYRKGAGTELHLHRCLGVGAASIF